MTLLSVNVNKIAVLRNSRGGELPSPVAAAQLCVAAGARGITVHPRPDRRHITPEDVAEIAAGLPANVEFNIEGNPFAPPRAGYPGLLALAASAKPAQVTFVPDGDGQITSDHGISPEGDLSVLAAHIGAFKAIGCRVSLFVDPGETRLEAFCQFGADRVEIYTGPFAEAFGRGDAGQALADCARTAAAAQALGMGVNAGHDLSQGNLKGFLAGVPGVLEVSIGHALIAEALVDGLAETVRRYRAITGG
jgi:pyridoxine 5-phosphate synthase